MFKFNFRRIQSSNFLGFKLIFTLILISIFVPLSLVIFYFFDAINYKALIFDFSNEFKSLNYLNFFKSVLLINPFKNTEIFFIFITILLNLIFVCIVIAIIESSIFFYIWEACMEDLDFYVPYNSKEEHEMPYDPFLNQEENNMKKISESNNFFGIIPLKNFNKNRNHNLFYYENHLIKKTKILLTKPKQLQDSLRKISIKRKKRFSYNSNSNFLILIFYIFNSLPFNYPIKSHFKESSFNKEGNIFNLKFRINYDFRFEFLNI